MLVTNLPICPVFLQLSENQSAFTPLGQHLFNRSKFQPPLSFIILGCIPCLTCTSFSVLGHKQKSHINHKSGELLQRVVTYYDDDSNLFNILLFGALEQRRSKSPFKWRSRSMERQDPFEIPAAGKIHIEIIRARSVL